MKTQVSNNFLDIQKNVKIVYEETKSILKQNSKIDKKQIKYIKKIVDTQINNFNIYSRYFDNINDDNLITIFILESLGIFDIQKEYLFLTIFSTVIDTKKLFKDKDFLIFLKHILIMNYIYTNKKEHSSDFNIDVPFIQNLKLFFGDIKSLILSYFLIFENNITVNKIQNISSYILKNNHVINIFSISDKNKLVLEQLTTGVKYEKLKEEPFNNIEYKRDYIKSKKFNILDSVQNSIRIKYISKQEFKYRFHKSPIEHERQGHYRILKNGKKIWINKSTINLGKVA